MRFFSRPLLLSCVVGFAVMACDGSNSVAPVPTVAVSVDRDTLVAFGETARATAIVANLEGYALTWRSTVEAVASVDPTGLVTAHSNGTTEIEVTAGPATGRATLVVQQRLSELVFTTEPGNGTGGMPLDPQPQVEARDANGNLLVGLGPTVTLALGSNPGGGTLFGMTEVELDEGVAGFSGLTIDRVGAGYTLVASLGGQPARTSHPFDILLGPPSPDSSTVVLLRDVGLVDDTLSVRVRLRDAGGNPLEQGGHVVAITVGENTGGLELVEVLDHDDGTYTVNLAATAPGTVSGIRALIDGELTAGPGVEATVFALQAISAGGSKASSPDVSLGTTCGLLNTGRLFCWGDGGFGKLGHGSFTSVVVPAPTPVSGLHEWSSVSAGRSMTCGIRTDATAFCWGSGSAGQLGNGQSELGSASNRSVPTVVVAPGGLKRIAPSLHVGTCGIDMDDRAVCWGHNGFQGRLGTGDTEPRSRPTPVQGELTFGSVTLGIAHGCGITLEGAAYCWGSNHVGLLGIGNTTPPQICGNHGCSFFPLPVTGGRSFVPGSIATTGNLTCAIEAGTLDAYCWGTGIVGDGSEGPVPVPTRVFGGLAFTQLSANDTYFCGVTTSGEVYCWGRNQHGQLGNGTQMDGFVPRRVDRTDHFVSVSTAQSHACALTIRGSAYCWGRNDRYELGDGTTTQRLSPTRVRMFR